MRTLLAFGLVLALAGFTLAADDKKADASGTWKWTVERNGNKMERTLTLKVDGDKVTGSMPGRNNSETKIEDGKVKDGEVTFTVTREMNGNKIVTKYKLKVDGDSLKGTAETERDGQTNKLEIDAKREKSDK